MDEAIGDLGPKVLLLKGLGSLICVLGVETKGLAVNYPGIRT
jgi:hypothetical protein